MKKIKLNTDWQYDSLMSGAHYSALIPPTTQTVNLPFCSGNRAILYRHIPTTIFRKNSRVFLSVSRTNGSGKVWLNDSLVGTIGFDCDCLELTPHLNSSRNILKLDIDDPSGLAGIADGVSLLVSDGAVLFADNGLYLSTDSIADDGAHLTAYVNLRTSTPVTANLQVEILNSRGRRVTRRVKKVNLKSDHHFAIPIRVPKPFLWQEYDPYMYTAVATIDVGGQIIDSLEVPLGIRTLTLNARTLHYNGSPIVLRGAGVDIRVQPMNQAATYNSAMTQLRLLHECGFNAIHVAGWPGEALLDAADQLGMLMYVDLLNEWSAQPTAYRAACFAADPVGVVQSLVRALRNHPSVVIYSLGNRVVESYGRAGGLELARQLVDAVRAVDPARLLTATIGELVPTLRELEHYGDKAALRRIDTSDRPLETAISIGREKDILRYATEEFVSLFDFVGYGALSHRYVTDKIIFPSRLIVGVDSPSDAVSTIWDEREKNVNILGDFCTFGIDSAMTDSGDIDCCLQRKPISFYREIYFGAKNTSVIATYDPETEDKSVPNARFDWNYPRWVGQPVTVDVYTSGDVVALYLNDKLVARKLAGKLNRRMARFEVPYHPGRLVAVSYYKGIENSRAELCSVSSPKAIRLIPTSRALDITNPFDTMTVIISVVDKENQRVNYAKREIHLSVSEELEIIAVGNTDPSFVTPTDLTVVPVSDGKAQVVVRARKEGKGTLTAVCDGLLTDKLRINIKNPAAKKAAKKK